MILTKENILRKLRSRTKAFDNFIKIGGEMRALIAEQVAHDAYNHAYNRSCFLTIQTGGVIDAIKLDAVINKINELEQGV